MNEPTGGNTKTRFSLSEVARGVGISPQNLHKTYIKKGKISPSHDDLGKPYIELVEVLRCFGSRFRPPELVSSVETVNSGDGLNKVQSDDAGLKELINQNLELVAQKAELERQLREKNDLLADAKVREDRLFNQVDKLTDTIKRIEGPKPVQEGQKSPDSDEKKPGWLSRLFGG